MAEDVRRSAEIRRMASQKVAAELVKGSTYESVEDAREKFLETVDWIDEDVVQAGDRAVAGVRRVRNQEAPETPPEATEVPTPALTPPNGSQAVSVPAGDLTDDQVSRMVMLMGKVDPELLKLKLWEMELPNTTIPEAVAAMKVKQGKQMVAWMKEQTEKEENV